MVQVVCPARGVYLDRRSRLRRPSLWDRYFFLTVNLLRGRSYLGERDFEWLASAPERRRQKHRSLQTAIRSRTALRWLVDRSLAVLQPSSAVQGFLRRAGLVKEPRGRSTALANQVYDLRAGETCIYSWHIQRRATTFATIHRVRHRCLLPAFGVLPSDSRVGAERNSTLRRVSDY